jgi:hypothetical protein
VGGGRSEQPQQEVHRGEPKPPSIATQRGTHKRGNLQEQLRAIGKCEIDKRRHGLKKLESLPIRASKSGSKTDTRTSFKSGRLCMDNTTPKIHSGESSIARSFRSRSICSC